MVEYYKGYPVFDLTSVAPKDADRSERIKTHVSELEISLERGRWKTARLAIEELDAIAMHDDNPAAVKNAKTAAAKGRREMRKERQNTSPKGDRMGARLARCNRASLACVH